MNVGAASASGDYLLFLHADSVLPPTFASDVIRMLSSADTVAGAFALTIDPSTPLMRLFSETTNFRSRLLQMPYGDQAIFLRRSTFHRIGGFPEIPIMEDVEFVRALTRLGRVRIANAIVRTSGRRWQERGAWRTSVLNQVLILAYHCGASPGRLYNCRESNTLPRLMELLRASTTSAAAKSDSLAIRGWGMRSGWTSRCGRREAPRTPVPPHADGAVSYPDVLA